MDAQQFLAEFGYIANAPEGINRMRELVLQLAVQGKLVSAAETSASSIALLGQVLKIRSRLVAEKWLPREKQYPSISEAKRTSDAPQHWQWAYFGEVWHLLSGRDLSPYQYNDSRAGIPYITGASNIENGSIAVNRWTTEPVVVSRTGDLLITCKGTIGKTAFNNIGDAHIARQIMAIRDFSGELEPRFLKIWLDGFVGELVKKSKSMIPGFSREDLAFAAYPVFPRAEQSRIVAKVEELIALCDQLEQQQQDRRKLQNVLRQSTLQALAGAQSPHELHASWQRLQANYGRLFSDPDDVRDFKGMVLNLAVSGRLLAPTHDPVSASKLLEQISSARSKWAETAEDQEKKEANAMLKKLRTQQVATPSDMLPDHWCWASLLEISQAIVDCHNKTAPYLSEGIHLVRTTDIRDGQMDLTRTRKISEETYAYWARRMPPVAGDIFFTREAPMGEAAIVPDGEQVCLGQRTMLIRLVPKLFSNRYLLYVIQSPNFQARMMEAAIGMAVKHLRVGGVEDLVVPVPPRDEQDEIVRIIDRLFALCDRHADYLRQGLRAAANLASSTVAVLTGIAVDSEEETPLKAPQTELVAPLRLGTLPAIGDQAPLATMLSRHNGEMRAQDLWQRWGMEKGVDAFYAQLKVEIEHGWIEDPSYVLDENAPDSSKKYPKGVQVAKMTIKQDT